MIELFLLSVLSQSEEELINVVELLTKHIRSLNERIERLSTHQNKEIQSPHLKSPQPFRKSPNRESKSAGLANMPFTLADFPSRFPYLDKGVSNFDQRVPVGGVTRGQRDQRTHAFILNEYPEWELFSTSRPPQSARVTTCNSSG